MIFLIIVIAVLGLAYANGANDNFKGVATLFGSGTTNYRRALLWATSTTLLGSCAAVFLAGNLIQRFGGTGLVDDAIAGQGLFAASVALGAGLTVLIATRIGMPISTTHSLVGGLVGTAIATNANLNFANLGSKFLLPLMISPLLAITITAVAYPLLTRMRKRMGVTRDFCLCVGRKTIEVVAANGQTAALQRAEQLSATMGEQVVCESRYQGKILGVSIGDGLDRCHFLSAGIVSFARGLNDTPKIAAMLLIAPMFGVGSSLILVGLVIAVGGILSARRVAETMSHKITAMNHGQGLTANVITGLIVIAASRFGLPVSTTHVSCGSLFGIGVVSGSAHGKMIATILLAWLVTLPMAAMLAAAGYFGLSLVGN